MLIDIHGHTMFFPIPPTEKGQRFATPEELMAMLKPKGVRAMVNLPSANPEGAHIIQSTEDALAVTEKYPDFFIPFMNIDPRQQCNSPTYDLGYLMRYYKDHGCKGLGEVCANIPVDDPRMDNLFKHAEACDLPVTFHMASKEGGMYGMIDHLHLPLLEGALKKFPKLRFLGHSPVFWSEISGDATEQNRSGYSKGKVTEGGALVRMMREYPMLCGDLSAGSGCNAVSRDPDFGYAFMTEFQDQLYFGLDICDPRNKTPLIDFLNEAVEGGHISREVYEKIGWKNAEKLLDLPPQ
ncbi:MAG: amidohydrolase family protein [Planctomycetota bacterium]